MTDKASSNLLRFAGQGNIRSAEKALTNGACVSYVGSDLNTPITKAAHKNQATMVGFLIEQGANINESDDDGSTPLIIAVKNGYSELVDLCLDHDADIEHRDNGDRSALYWAVDKCLVDIVKRLANETTNFNAIFDKRSFKETLLCHAARRGKAEIVNYLLDCGADINKTNVYKETPLILAAKSGRFDVVRLLMERDADHLLKSGSKMTALDYAIKQSKGVDMRMVDLINGCVEQKVLDNEISICRSDEERLDF